MAAKRGGKKVGLKGLLEVVVKADPMVLQTVVHSALNLAAKRADMTECRWVFSTAVRKDYEMGLVMAVSMVAALVVKMAAWTVPVKADL